MRHRITIDYDDETRLATVSPEYVLMDRALCYAMLGLAHEIVTRNGLAAPAFKPEQTENTSSDAAAPGPQPPDIKYGVQPCRTRITPPKE